MVDSTQFIIIKILINYFEIEHLVLGSSRVFFNLNIINSSLYVWWSNSDMEIITKGVRFELAC